MDDVVKESDSKISLASEDIISCRSGEVSSAETVSSAPGAEHSAPSPTAQGSVVKKSDSSLWIKNVSPNTKAADLKVGALQVVLKCLECKGFFGSCTDMQRFDREAWNVLMRKVVTHSIVGIKPFYRLYSQNMVKS